LRNFILFDSISRKQRPRIFSFLSTNIIFNRRNVLISVQTEISTISAASRNNCSASVYVKCQTVTQISCVLYSKIGIKYIFAWKICDRYELSHP